MNPSPDSDSPRSQQLQERDVLRQVDALLTRLAEQNAAIDEAEVAADVAAAIAEARSDNCQS